VAAEHAPSKTENQPGNTRQAPVKPAQPLKKGAQQESKTAEQTRKTQAPGPATPAKLGPGPAKASHAGATVRPRAIRPRPRVATVVPQHALASTPFRVEATAVSDETMGHAIPSSLIRPSTLRLAAEPASIVPPAHEPGPVLAQPPIKSEPSIVASHEPTPDPRSVAPRPAAVEQLPRDVLTNEGIVTLAEAGFSDSFILEKITLGGRTKFDTSAEGLSYLRRHAISQELARFIMHYTEQPLLPPPVALAMAPMPEAKKKRKKTSPPQGSTIVAISAATAQAVGLPLNAVVQAMLQVDPSVVTKASSVWYAAAPNPIPQLYPFMGPHGASLASASPGYGTYTYALMPVAQAGVGSR